MNQKEMVALLAAEINQKSAYVTASVSREGNLVLTSKQAGTSAPMTIAQIYGGITAQTGSLLETAQFSKGEPLKELVVVGNEGDTYFQRWDSVKSMPRSNDDVNQVLDIASVMIETHINLDGRTDLDRGIKNLTSIDWSNFGKLNSVYSQQNNFLAAYDYDESLNLDSYPSSITWTMQKSSNAEVDEWTHITLASTLALDGDKGPVQALRRFNNSVLAFQDKGISEILFNTRTQLSTAEGVPVEIANSGKVDGKRYLSNKHGITNKWAITEGKAGLYFINNTDGAFCRYNGGGIDDLSGSLGFSAWFRENSNNKPWTPANPNSIVSFYDKRYSDVYLTRSDESLVFNETLGVFSSFYDYAKVSMMVNVSDKFISFRDNYLWRQNEGLFGEFFGTSYPYWTTYRATPDPYGDKIWTNIEYRADAYEMLNEVGEQIRNAAALCTDEAYRKDETFDFIKVWNEYQQTANIVVNPIKKFRTWRLAIPRAIKTDTNKYGLDRIHNPWVNVQLKKSSFTGTENRDLMQLHNVILKYFE